MRPIDGDIAAKCYNTPALQPQQELGSVAIVVIGAGAIGILVAGRLARLSQRTVLLARPALAATLQQQPPRILQNGRLEVAPHLVVIGDPAALPPGDHKPELAIVCVKGYDTASVFPLLDAIEPRAILTLQNGIGNEETLAAQYGSERIISGAITTSVEVEAPGRVAVAKSGGIGLAPMQIGTDIAACAAVLRAAGFQVGTYPDYRALKWSKALLNMLGNATAAILDQSVAAVYADPRLIALERRAFLEALHVMERRAIHPINLPRYPAALLAVAMRRVPAPLLNPLLRLVIAGGRGSKPPSLQLDLARGNHHSEGEFLYGAIACAAAHIGVAAPVNQRLWDVLRAIVVGDVAWEVYRHHPDALVKALSDIPSNNR